jgi:hypothetical protein
MPLRPKQADPKFQASLQAIEALFGQVEGGIDWAELEAPDAPASGDTAGPAVPTAPSGAADPSLR